MCITIIPPTSLSFPCRRESKRPRRRTGRFYTLPRLTLKRGRGYDRHHHAYSHNSHRLFRRHGDRAAAGFRSELQPGACARRLQARTVRTVGVDAHDAGPGPSPTPELREEELANFNAQEGPPPDDDDDGSPDRSKRSLDQECRDFPGASFCPPPPTSLRISVLRRRRHPSVVCPQPVGHPFLAPLPVRAASGFQPQRLILLVQVGSRQLLPGELLQCRCPRLLVQGAGVRCENSDYTGCGDWSAFTDPIELDAELKRGSATEDSDSGWVRVTAAPDARDIDLRTGI